MDCACLAYVIFLQLMHLIVGEANSYIEDAKKLSVPTFLPTQLHYQHTVGDTAFLECAVENLGKKSVSWRKVSSNKVLTVGSVSFSGNPRYEVEHPPGSSLWNLIIRDLRSSDAGVYECQISAKVRHLRHHVTLLVSDEVTTKKAKKPNIRITGADFVDKGKRLYLICNATATEQPPEDLDWFREGNRLQTSEEKGIYIRKFVTLSTSTIVSILEIKHAQLDDGGVYVCRTSSLDVTSFRVNVLNGDKNNVKRAGTEYVGGIITITELLTTIPTSTDHSQDREGGSPVFTTDFEVAAVDHSPAGSDDHTQETGRHVGSTASEVRHHLGTSCFTAAVMLIFNHLLSQVT
ncbi:hypothetical protein ACOMHN_042501 [Nucella lapillus]